MVKYASRHVFGAIITLLAATAVVFGAGRLTGDPVKLLLSLDTATEAEEERIRRELHLDEPMWKQYVEFVTGAAQGDFGISYRSRQPVSDTLKRRWWPSISLAVVAVTMAVVISVPLGVLAATKRGSPIDTVARAIALLGQAAPSFWLGIVFVWLFAVRLGWFPSGGGGDWRFYVLPGFTLAWLISSGIVRLLRSSMIEVLGSDYVRFARSYGMPEWRVVWVWALRNALIPVATFVGFMFSIIVAGAVVVEVVFAWPGLGRLSYEAVLSRDFPVLQAVVLIWAALAILAALLTDLAYAGLDPRIRR